MKKDGLFSVFSVFQDREAYFENLISNHNNNKATLNQALIIFGLAFFYGIVMGSYNSINQAMVTGIKVPSLLLLALLICFPAFYVIQYMLGSRLSLMQMINTILSGFVVLTTIMASFAPIVVFFMITGNNYAFLKLLHVGIFTFSGIFGMYTIIEALKYSCEKKSVYPKIGIRIFKIWIVIFAFVGMQLAWNLRPFIGDRNLPTEIFREREGNFYLAVFQSIGNVFGVNNPDTPKVEGNRENPPKQNPENDSLQSKMQSHEQSGE